MVVVTIGKPGDFSTTFSLLNRSTPDMLAYGITADGKIYRARTAHDALAGVGGRGTWVDTGVVVPDVALATDL
jgi:hypothetical protein